MAPDERGGAGSRGLRGQPPTGPREESGSSGPPKRHRPRLGPRLGPAVAAAVVVAIVLATDGFTAVPWGRGSDHPTSGPGRGGGVGERNTSILPSGTVWALDAGEFRAVWFDASGVSAVWGNLRATGAVYYYLVLASVFSTGAAGNTTSGHAGNLSTLAAASNWSRESPVHVSMSEQLLGPGAFDFVAADAGSAPRVEVTITPPGYEEPVGAG